MRDSSIGAIVAGVALVAALVIVYLTQPPAEEAPTAIVADETVRFASAFAGANPQTVLEFCRIEMYEHLPYAAPARALAVSAQVVDGYFELSVRRHEVTHLRCSAEGLSEEIVEHPYGSLLPSEQEALAEAPPELPYQNLWSEADRELRLGPHADLLELWVRPDNGEWVLRRWTHAAAGWTSELSPADAPAPQRATTVAGLPDS